MDFSYCNICFDLKKKLIKVLCYDLQVTIHKGLVKVQADILKAIANFVDNFHIEVTTLSAPQVHALLVTCMLIVPVVILSWLPSSRVQHLPGQSLSCGMVLSSYFSPSLTGFETIKQTLKGVPPIQHIWRLRSTIAVKYFKHTWWM